MAVTFDAVGPAASVPAASASPRTWTHVNAGNCIIVGLACSTGGTNNFTTVTYGGTALTFLGYAASNNNTLGGVSLYGLVSGSLPTGSNTVSATFTGGGTAEGGSVSFKNASALGTVFTAAGNSAAPSVGVIGTSAGGMVAAAEASGTVGTETATTGTLRYSTGANGNAGSGAGNMAGSTIPSAGGTTTATFGITADWWGIAAVEVQGTPVFDGGSSAWPNPWPPAMAGQFGPAQPFAVLQDFSIDPPATVVALAGLASATGTAPNVGPPVITGLSGGTSADYFTDQAHNPRWMFCDSIWTLIYSAGRSGAQTWQQDIDQVVSTRASQGYTAIQTNLLPNNEYVTANGTTWDGIHPFNTGTDPTSGLNSTYWARADYLAASMAAHGIAWFANLLMGEDLATGVAGSWTSAQKTAYGNAVASRYAATPNLVWMIGDDGGVDDTTMTNILTGVRNAGDTRHIAVENPQETTSRFGLKLNDVQTWGTGNAQYNWIYTYAPSYGGVEYAYAESSAIPVIRGDGYYYNSDGSPSDKISRESFWWCISSGSRGYSWGMSDGGWGAFATGWANNLTMGADEIGTAGDFQNNVFPAVTAFLTTLPNWQKLAPDTANAFITAGRGTRAPYQTEGIQNQYTGTPADTYVSGSYAADGSIAMIYFSRGVTTTITIDQTKLASGYTGKWVDPATCATTTATTGSTYTKPSSANSAGDHDWLLLLQASTGTTANAGLATGTGAALQPVIAITAFAGLATGTGAAQAPSAAVTANAGLATGTGTAQPPLPAVTANAGLATGTGAALAPLPVVTAFAGLATGTGTALQPTVSTSGNTTANAGLATGTGAALSPAVTVAPNAGLATGTGAALQPSVTVTASSGLASGTGAALQPAIAITVPAGLATGTGAALQPTVQTSGNTTANAGLATGTGAALSPVVTITPAAGLSSGTGAALAPVPAVTANAGLATGTGAALQPSVQTSGSTTANAQLAAGTGTAQPPVAMVTALAGLASGTGAALNGQRIIPAGLATGTGAALTAVLAATAQASAAQALAAALNGTIPAQHVPAKSTASVTATDTSASSVTDPRDGTDAVTAVATSAPSVS